ncbi:MAG: GNAT family N-acetyltransferase [Anaerolineae bacterium]
MPSEYDGPREPREQEWPAVVELSRSIFFPNAPSYSSAAHTWPMAALPSELRQGGLAIFHDGQPVSVILRFVRDILVSGCPLRLGYIGGVCTHSEHRGKGLASTILAAMLEQYRREDVDFAYISGNEGLYYRAGANHVAMAVGYEVSVSMLAALSLEVRVRPATLSDAGILVALAEGEGVRFLRPREDYEAVLIHQHCGGRPCVFHLVEWCGVPAAYLLLGTGHESQQQEVLEFAGERTMLLSALGTILRDSGTPSLLITIPHGDRLGDFLRALGAKGRPVKSDGTVKLVSFTRTMEKLLPYFQERLAGWGGLDLEAAEGNGRYSVWNERGTLQIAGEDNALWALLGRPADVASDGLLATGAFRELVDVCLPIPLPPVHLNVI